MSKLENKEEYSKFVDSKVPPSPIFTNCLKAFLVGGLICMIGQIIFELCSNRGIPESNCYTIVSISLIFLSAFLTALKLYQPLG